MDPKLEKFGMKVREFIAKEPFGLYEVSKEDLEVFCKALTHDSYSNEWNDSHEDHIDSYERLEFYGDAILECIVCQFAFDNLDVKEGILTEFKQEFVKNKKIAERVRDYNERNGGLDIENMLQRGNGQSNTKTKKDPLTVKMVADCFEALVAACCITRGFEMAKDMVYKVILRDDLDIDGIIAYLEDEKAKKDVHAMELNPEVNPGSE